MLQQSHSQKMQEMSHEIQLKLMTYLVMMLSTVLLAGLGFVLYRRKK
jgi:LPXTG-motif cell wall-anchored protein